MWSGRSGITQDSGTILYLLYAAAYFNEPAFRDKALEGGAALLATGVETSPGSVLYRGFYNVLQELVGGDPHDPEGDFFPNFAYGTSGISYTLARLYEESKDPAWLAAAEKGAEYLISIAVPVKEGKLIPYHYPNNEDGIFYLGFCHGPAGTARLFILLHRLTGKRKYRDFADELTQGMIGAGAPEYHSAGYWDVHCLCCGTAAFVHYFLGLWMEYREPRYLEYGLRSGKVLLGSAHYDGKHASWYQAFMRSEPGNISADIGYFDGAAGIGAALLQVSQALKQRLAVIRLPDDPFLSS
jgi:lantibiotic modifying enzyme